MVEANPEGVTADILLTALQLNHPAKGIIKAEVSDIVTAAIAAGHIRRVSDKLFPPAP